MSQAPDGPARVNAALSTAEFLHHSLIIPSFIPDCKRLCCVRRKTVLRHSKARHRVLCFWRTPPDGSWSSYVIPPTPSFLLSGGSRSSEPEGTIQEPALELWQYAAAPQGQPPQRRHERRRSDPASLSCGLGGVRGCGGRGGRDAEGGVPYGVRLS